MISADILRALAGGVLIGVASAGLLLANGRIAGISGMLRGLLAPRRAAFPGDLLFLAGVIAGAWGWQQTVGNIPLPRPHFPAPWLVAGGFLVGLGTVLANGCTSGHGVCGLARRSLRSLVAVGLFLASAIVTTYLMRHALGIL